MTPRLARYLAPGAAALLLVAAGCSADEPEPAPTTTVEPSTMAAAKGDPPAPDAPIVWPLTGETTEQVAERPALAIKVENSPQARPQTGLEEADMVWEEVVEGGITRFVAVYHSTVPDAVEPVRSVRPMDPAIVAPLDGILAYSGAQQPFIQEVAAAGVQSVIMDAGDAGFSRDPARFAPHDVVGDPQTFLDQADGERTVPPPAQFAFARSAKQSTVATDGASASSLDVVMSRAQTTGWDWDGDSGTWWRSEGSSESVSTSGDRHAAANVVVLEADVVNTSYSDASGAPVPETQLVASGKGLVAAAGSVLEVEWSKESLQDPVVLTADGEAVELAPGSTWVELMPSGTGSWSTS